MIPILYSATETAFTSNGLGRLFDCVECLVTEERNGLFECEFKYPITGRHYADIVEGCYISCTHDDDGDRQPFRIYRRSAPIDGVVTFNARHISYVLSNIIVSPFTAANIGAAFTGFGTYAINTNPFTFWTDKTTVATFKVDNPTSIRGIMGGVEGSILDVYGGEWDYDGLTVKLWAARGTNSGVTIRYGKNLSDINQTKDAGNTYNSVVPFWRGDVNGVDTLVTVPGYLVTAAGVTDPVPVVMDMSGDFDSQPTANQLQTAAAAFLANNTPWVPSETLKVDFVALWQTSDYADVANLQKVRLCDTVNVVYPALGVTATGIKVVKVIYDVLRERYAEMELGEPSVNFSDVLTAESAAMINKVNTDTKSFFESEIAHATDLITGGQGGYVRFGLNAYGQPEEIYIMDTASILTATNILRLNKNGIGFSTNGGSTYSTAWTIDGLFVADFIKSGTLSTVMIQGPTADTYWDLLSGEFQNYGTSTVTAQVETAQGTYTPTQYTVNHKTRIASGRMTLKGQQTGGTERVYMDIGLAAEGMDYEFYEDVIGTNRSASYPYADVNLYGDQVTGLSGGNNVYDGNVATYRPGAHYTPDYIKLGCADDLSAANEYPDRNQLRLAAGWGNHENGVVFIENYRWAETPGGTRRLFKAGIERRPAWEYAEGDNVEYPNSDDSRIICAGYLTDERTTVRFQIPLCRPFAAAVASVDIYGEFKIRLEGSYIAGSGNATADFSDYTVTCTPNACGLGVKLKKTNNGTWSGSNNNHGVLVDLYGLGIIC